MTWRITTGALLSLLLLLVIRWLLPHGEVDTAPPELDTRFDYVLSDFSARFLDSEGQPALLVSGPRLEHDPQTHFAMVDHPEFVIESADGRWFGQAESGRIDRNRDQLLLEKDVHLRTGPEGPYPMEFNGQRLLLDHRGGTIASDDPVTMRRPGTELRAGGLRVFLATDTVELYNHVEGHFSIDPDSADWPDRSATGERR